MNTSKRKHNKKIDEICSAGSSLTMIVALIILFKYRNYWQVITCAIIIFLLCFAIIIFFITRIIRQKRIERAMITDNYDNMSGEQFEEFCADILRGNGFENVEVTKASGDHGVDVLATKDGQKYAIQCKRYSKPVGNKAVQEVYSGKDIYKADIAVVMSNMDFTAQAIEDAKKLRVELWNKDCIYLMQKNGNVNNPKRVNEEKKQICPKCGGSLVIRTTKKGSNAGTQFYGCSNYPNCRFTKDI